MHSRSTSPGGAKNRKADRKPPQKKELNRNSRKQRYVFDDAFKAAFIIYPTSKEDRNLYGTIPVFYYFPFGIYGYHCISLLMLIYSLRCWR
jgi:hypothetical protein